jgi:hypothetical protein
VKFGLRPSSGRAGTHVSLRTEREREFGDVVPVRGIDNHKEIVIAGRQIDLLDLNFHFLGEFPSSFGALGSVLDRADSRSVHLSEHMNIGMPSSMWLLKEIADRCGSRMAHSDLMWSRRGRLLTIHSSTAASTATTRPMITWA